MPNSPNNQLGSLSSTERPQDRADVVEFFEFTTPTLALNQAARQIAEVQGQTLSQNARALALTNMAINDSFVAAFFNKYHYNFWRPETAIRAGDTDRNPKTEADPNFLSYIATPCFPSYHSNHASGTNGGTEVLRRLYGEGGHSITLSNPAVPNIVLTTPRSSRFPTMWTTPAFTAAYTFESTKMRAAAWDGLSEP